MQSMVTMCLVRHVTHRFLAEQEKLTEQRLQELNMILEGDIQCPDHILDTLHHLR